MGKIEEVFGKDSGIKESDIQARVVENELEESLTIEYKAVGRSASLDDELIESVLIKPLVSLLNTAEHQSSLLIIGVAAKQHVPTDIEPVPEMLLSAEKIGSLIKSKIGVIPAGDRFPNLRVVSTKCGSRGHVHLIELNSWEPGAYFSRVTNQSYVRRTDSSERLDLPEFMTLASRSAGSAATLVIRGVQVKSEGNPTRTTYTIDFQCENHGMKPASFVAGFVEVKMIRISGVEVTADDSQFTDVTQFNPGMFRIFAFSVNRENNWPVYPESNVVIGTIAVSSPTPAPFELQLSTNDGDGRTVEVLRVTPKGRVRKVSGYRKAWG